MLAVGEEMQQRHVEQRGVPQEGEVTAVGRISRSGARDRGSDIFGVRALDRLVAVVLRHQHRICRPRPASRPMAPPRMAGSATSNSSPELTA